MLGAQMRRRRLPAAIVTTMTGQKVHDRLAQDLPRNAKVAPLVVDDPHGIETGEKITVLRSLRDDPLAQMHARSQIDQAQYYAGRHWQKAYELAELGGSRAIDPTKEAVDGGRIPEPLTDQQAKAFGDLKKASRALGINGELIVKDILAVGLELGIAAARRGYTSEPDRKAFGKRFRECLDTLAEIFGYAMRRI
jgi:hypothetical protein